VINPLKQFFIYKLTMKFSEQEVINPLKQFFVSCHIYFHMVSEQ
jgi:hypothetical protein